MSLMSMSMSMCEPWMKHKCERPIINRTTRLLPLPRLFHSHTPQSIWWTPRDVVFLPPWRSLSSRSPLQLLFFVVWWLVDVDGGVWARASCLVWRWGVIVWSRQSRNQALGFVITKSCDLLRDELAVTDSDFTGLAWSSLQTNFNTLERDNKK